MPGRRPVCSRPQGSNWKSRSTSPTWVTARCRELPLDDIKVCHHRQDEGCDCRKPRPGTLREAIRELELDVVESFMVGDSWSDDVVGRRVG